MAVYEERKGTVTLEEVSQWGRVMDNENSSIIHAAVKIDPRRFENLMIDASS